MQIHQLVLDSPCESHHGELSPGLNLLSPSEGQVGSRSHQDINTKVRQYSTQLDLKQATMLSFKVRRSTIQGQKNTVLANFSSVGKKKELE